MNYGWWSVGKIYFDTQWNIFTFNKKYLIFKKMYLYPIKYFCTQHKIFTFDEKTFDIWENTFRFSKIFLNSIQNIYIQWKRI